MFVCMPSLATFSWCNDANDKDRERTDVRTCSTSGVREKSFAKKKKMDFEITWTLIINEAKGVANDRQEATQLTTHDENK